MSQPRWQWENAAAGALAGLATVAATHPLDVVRTRFQANDGRVAYLPTYRNTAQALFTIARSEGLRGLYAGFLPAVLGSSLSWGLYFFFYGRAKKRYSAKREESLSPGLHLASAAEAGALVSLCTHPVWLIKTRLQLQNPLRRTRAYSGFYGLPHTLHWLPNYVISEIPIFERALVQVEDMYPLESTCNIYAYPLLEKFNAFTTIMREEGWRALYKGIVPSLFLVSHGVIQFTSYEELRKVVIKLKAKGREERPERADKMLNSVDYAIMGASSKLAAILLCYPFQVIRTRLQQRPYTDGTPRYIDTWHVAKATARFEGLRGFYKGITPNLLKNVPASSITFTVYENVMKLLRLGRTQE